jgi:phage protein U
MAYGQLGDILFEGLYTPDEEDRTDSVSLPQLSRINRRPLQQFTGVDLGVIKLTMTLHNSFVDVEEAITKFREYRESATHLKYITGSGSVKGNFVIQKTTQKLKRADRDGNFVYVVLEHTLIELSSSNPQLESVNNALANSRNNPTVYSIPVRVPAPTIEASAALDVVSSRASSITAFSEYSTAPVEPSNVVSKMDKVRERLLEAKEDISKAVDKVQISVATAQQAQAYAANMYQMAVDLQTAADSIANADFSNPLTGLESISTDMGQMTSSVAVMSNTSQPLAALIGSRQ